MRDEVLVEFGARGVAQMRRAYSEARQGLEGVGEEAGRTGRSLDESGDQADRMTRRYITGLQRIDRVAAGVHTGLRRSVGGISRLGMSAASGLGGAMGAAGAASAVAVTAIGAGVVTGARSLLDLSSQMEATGNKAQIVFGTQLGSVDRWAAGASAKMGLTRRQAVGLAADFADLMVPMGFTRKQASSMSTDILSLSGALSQWSGGQRSSAEVSGILSAAMLGERDALQGLGISISQAEVDASVLAATHARKLTPALKQQAEALATQRLIMAKSTDAQDAYARGGNRLLTSQARLGSSWRTLREEAATRFSPYAVTALEGLQRRLPAILRAGKDFVGGFMPPLRAGFRSLGDSLGRVSDRFGGLAGMQGKAGGLGETFGRMSQAALLFIGKASEMFGVAYQKGAQFFSGMLDITSRGMTWLSGVFGKLAILPGKWGDEFGQASVALAGASADAKALSIAVDLATRPRTMAIQLSVTEQVTEARRDAALARRGPALTAATGGLSALAREGRAAGGPVRALRPYLVGEDGWEFFAPRVDGFIVNQQQAAAAAAQLLEPRSRGGDGAASPTVGLLQPARLAGPVESLGGLQLAPIAATPTAITAPAAPLLVAPRTPRLEQAAATSDSRALQTADRPQVVVHQHFGAGRPPEASEVYDAAKKGAQAALARR